MADASTGLKKAEIFSLVNDYIGVSGGHLGDFSVRTLEEFLVGLELGIDLRRYQGTKRQVFIDVVSAQNPNAQATILEAVLRKYPAESAPVPGSGAKRTPALHDQILGWAARLRRGTPIAKPDLQLKRQDVEEALADVEKLGAANSVDRVCTALHGYLETLCTHHGVTFPIDPTMPALLKALAQSPVFNAAGPRSGDVAQVLRALGTILNSLLPVRNQASLAHANPLLPDPEARLVVNAAMSILHYVDAKARLAGGGVRGW